MNKILILAVVVLFISCKDASNNSEAYKSVAESVF
jgi:hypothetical protein